MRADIVDRGIEHGATKFIVNGRATKRVLVVVVVMVVMAAAAAAVSRGRELAHV